MDQDQMRIYINAVMDAGHCHSFRELDKRCFGKNAHVNGFYNGQRNPTMGILRKLERFSGVSLDVLDPRINRGEAWVCQLGAAMRENGWSVCMVSANLSTGRETILQMRDRGTYSCNIYPDTLIALCDVMEGRQEMLKASAARRTARPKSKPETPAAALPAEAKGDAFYLEALQAFRRIIHPNPKWFHLTTVAPGRVEGYGTELMWRVEKTARGATVTCLFRRNGNVCGQWTA